MAQQEDRFKVAASTAAVVPFNCVVCFDEFSLKERPPVVLPCGHTYICAPCSKRIKRCMECREPLFLTIKSTQQQHCPRTPILPAPTMYGRYSPTPSTPPQPLSLTNTTQQQQLTQQIPLSIPKNVVLICMMEAAERQTRANNTTTNSKSSEREELRDDTNGSMNASDEDEEYDLNRIISGMATFSGPCGTYAVKERNGLTISYNALNNNSDDVDDDDGEDDDEDDDEGRIENEIESATTGLHVTASYDSIEVSNPCTLKRGQTVQVVRFENGVATLARDTGYIHATTSQLVKVGGPLEKACRLEGLLDTVVSRGKDLQRELEENSRIEEAIRREIEAELQVQPDHPVVTEVTDSSEDIHEPTTPKSSATNNELPTFGTPHESPLTGQSSVKKATDLGEYQIGPFPRSPNDTRNIDGDTPEFRAPGLPAYRTRQTTSSFDEESIVPADYGCGAAILGNSAFRLFTNSSTVGHQPQQSVPIHENQFTVVSHVNSYGNSHYSRFRSMSSDVANQPDLGSTSSFDAIDFRTGMSGHRGLNNSSTSKLNPHGYSPTPHYYGSRFMMSEHRGIARVRGPLQKISAFNTTSSP